MTFDLLDQAFLQHAADRPCPPIAAPGGVASARGGAGAHALVQSAGPAVAGVGGLTEPAAFSAADALLAQLLEDHPEQWWTVADRVCAAREAGHRVIAIAGHRSGEGRTTLMRGVAVMLEHLDWQVKMVESATAWWRELIGDPATWQWRQQALEGDRDVVLVDAGIWFPPGPLRIHQLRNATFGFDAVLMVRHHDVSPCPASEQALAATGVRLIGEVVSFAPVAYARAA